MFSNINLFLLPASCAFDLQLAINYQTSHLGITFDEFLLNEVNHSISYPVTGAPNYKKIITLALAPPDLGPKRKAALPYLFTSRGLRGYHSFLNDPDLYISRLQCLPGIFLDECTGAVQEAQHRVTLRTQKAVHDTQGAISGGPSFNSAASSDPIAGLRARMRERSLKLTNLSLDQ